MAFITDAAFDAALNHIRSNGEQIHICSSAPTSYSNVATVTLGNKASPTIATPSDRTGGGRKITLNSFSDGSVTGTGTASHWALVDATGTALLAHGALNASQAVTSGNTFGLDAFDIGISDAT